MTTEPGQNAEPKRRKFDDVTSLFEPIVPGAGAASQFPPHRPAFIPMPTPSVIPNRRAKPQASPPTTQPEESPDVPEDDELAANLPRNVRITTVPSAADARVVPALSLRVEPPPPTRPRPAEIPWPDAFEPRPNYRNREPKKWSWLLLIPAGLVAAAAITLIDARTVRNWIETTILHRAPTAGIIDSPLMPQPFRTSPTTTVAPAGAENTAPVAPPNPYPALPTSPVPVPPGTEVSPPPPDPAETATTAAAPIRVTIQYRRNIPGADGEARRLAALLQSYGGSVELHPTATTVRAATINYYNPGDKDAAAALASVLANEAPTWIVRLGTIKNPPGTLDIWLP